MAWPHYWRVKTRLPERFRQPCRVLVRGRRNTILVEFPDGYRVVTSRHYVRRRATGSTVAQEASKALAPGRSYESRGGGDSGVAGPERDVISTTTT